MVAKDIGLALFFVFCCAASLTAQKIASQEISVYIMNFIRLILVIPVMAFIVRKWPRPFTGFLIGGIFWNVLNYIFLGLALQKGVGVSVSAVLIQTNSFFVVILSSIFFKENISTRSIIGMVIAAGGIIKLSGGDFISLLNSHGILFLLLQSLSWSIGFIILKTYKIGSTIQDVVWLCAISALPFLAVALYFDQSAFNIEYLSHISIQAYICIAISGLLATVLSTYIWLKLGQKYPSTILMPFTFLMPVFSAIIAYITMNEIPSHNALISMVIIMSGVVIAQGWLTRLVRQTA